MGGAPTIYDSAVKRPPSCPDSLIGLSTSTSTVQVQAAHLKILGRRSVWKIGTDKKVR